MSKRNVKSTEEKLKIVNLYLEKGKSISSLIREYGVSDTTIRTWVRKYKHLGIAGLRESKNLDKVLKRNQRTSRTRLSIWTRKFGDDH